MKKEELERSAAARSRYQGSRSKGNSYGDEEDEDDEGNEGRASSSDEERRGREKGMYRKHY